jgi:sporulation protein YlmC with PRC-barrel domain
MIRTLLATTALTALLIGGAVAQDASSSMSVEPALSSAPATTTDTTAANGAARTPVTIASGYTRVSTDRLASKIIGQSVYDSTAKDANDLGKITDLVLNHNGDVAAVVLGVGGFLGMGEKEVAVDFSALQWTTAADNTNHFVLQTTKDELTNAPDFKTVDAK